MEHLIVVGRSTDALIVETTETGTRFSLPVTEALRTAIDDFAGPSVAKPLTSRLAGRDSEGQMRPREIQARIRAGASITDLASEAGMPLGKVERFANPVLLERARASELARAAHPIRHDGPAVESLDEIIAAAFTRRGASLDGSLWDAWRDVNSRWIIQLQWLAGRSENFAHWCYQPGAHGGTIVALDDVAAELIDPDQVRPLRTLAVATAPASAAEPVVRPAAALAAVPPAGPPKLPAQPQLPLYDQAAAPPAPVAETADAAELTDAADDEPRAGDTLARPAPRRPRKAESAATSRARTSKGKPAMPSWEDVLLGVRSTGRG